METIEQLLKEYPNSKILNAFEPLKDSIKIELNYKQLFTSFGDIHTYVLTFTPKTYEEVQEFLKTNLVKKTSFGLNEAIKECVYNSECKDINNIFVKLRFDSDDVREERLDKQTFINLCCDVKFGLFFKDEDTKTEYIQSWYNIKIKEHIVEAEEAIENFNANVFEIFKNKIDYKDIEIEIV